MKGKIRIREKNRLYPKGGNRELQKSMKEEKEYWKRAEPGIGSVGKGLPVQA